MFSMTKNKKTKKQQEKEAILKEKEKPAKKGTFWTEEEYNQLREYWGTFSTPTIAKKMGRTVCTIKSKAAQLGLGRQTDNSDLVSLNSILIEIGFKKTRSWHTKKLIKAGLPIHTQRVDKQSIRMVDIDEFWDFLKNHPGIIDFSKLEEYTFGCEPEWVKNRRSNDYQRKKLMHSRYEQWTEQEEKELVLLVKSQNYTYFDISKKLRRSEHSILRRLTKLGVTERPLKMSTHNHWTPQETAQFEKMLKEGSEQ